ncbi:MAG: hypothetical protein NVSMB47_15920 [Polyangiales bacterium]
MLPRRRPLLRCALAALLVTGACAAPACTARSPDLVTRMNTAKSLAESFGYTAAGAPSTGNVEEGKDARVALPLKPGCYQVFVFPGDGLKAVDLSLVDPAGKPAASGTKGEGQSAIKQCVGEAATYTLIVKSTGGSGAFIAQPYLSGQPAPGKGDDGAAVTACSGPDCDDPNPGDGQGGVDDCSGGNELTLGSPTKGSTLHKVGNVRPSCAASDGSVAIYRTHVDGRHKLVVDLSAKFDAVLAVFRTANDGYMCDSTNELECSDDSEGLTTKSHVETVVDTGDYGVMIAGFDGDRGEFEVKAQLADAPSLESICATAKPITPGTKVDDVLDGNGSNVRASCSNGDGDESLRRLELKARARLRVSARGSVGEVTLSLRNRCEDPASEIACSNRFVLDAYSWTGLANAGSYTLIADSNDPSHTGSLELQVDSAPELGAGTAEAETCKDAKPIAGSTTTPLSIDTFEAKGDVHVSCAADAAADVVYKLDVKSKSRVFVSANPGDDDGRHVVALQKACGDSKGELACELLSGKGIEATVDPGSYFLIIKGKGAEDFGRARLNVHTRDLGDATKACKAAPKLASGVALTDVTTGAPDKFVSPGCGGAIAQQQSGDKVYQLTLKERSHVNVQLKQGTFYNAILSLRSDCNDLSKGEIVCASQYSKIIDRDRDPGTYYVVVDGFGTTAEGTYTIEMTSKAIK